jgi:hypothetical protein
MKKLNATNAIAVLSLGLIFSFVVAGFATNSVSADSLSMSSSTTAAKSPPTTVAKTGSKDGGKGNGKTKPTTKTGSSDGGKGNGKTKPTTTTTVKTGN